MATTNSVWEGAPFVVAGDVGRDVVFDMPSCSTEMLLQMLHKASASQQHPTADKAKLSTQFSASNLRVERIGPKSKHSLAEDLRPHDGHEAFGDKNL